MSRVRSTAMRLRPWRLNSLSYFYNQGGLIVFIQLRCKRPRNVKLWCWPAFSGFNVTNLSVRKLGMNVICDVRARFRALTLHFESLGSTGCATIVTFTPDFMVWHHKSHFWHVGNPTKVRISPCRHQLLRAPPEVGLVFSVAGLCKRRH